MQTIGITGGIGSGKSLVARILKQLGYPVYIADKEASRLMEEHPGLRQDMAALYGPGIYTGKNLNKLRLADLIFNDRTALQAVNRLVHPRVMEDFRQWSGNQCGPLAFFESAILFEAGMAGYFDRILCVTAPENLRIARVLKRDRTTPDKLRERIRNQWDDREKCRRADFVIHNDGSHSVIRQLQDCLARIGEKQRE